MAKGRTMLRHVMRKMDEHQIKSPESVSRRKMTRVSLGSFGVLLACALAGLALPLSGPAAAQTVICDSSFGTWQLQIFACPTASTGGNNNTVVATQQFSNGSIG